jgi:hypothetical protein
MDFWLFPASKKVYICIFLTSITEVVTVGLTSVKHNGQNSNFTGRKPPRYLNESIFEYGIHFPIAHQLIESCSVFGA